MSNPRLNIIGIPIVSLIISVVFFVYIPLYKITGIMKALDGILLLSSISLGFYGACLGVLASIFNTNVVRDIMGDRDYRKEFINLACLSLITGFLTVITTIVFQVVLENKGIGDVYLRSTNAAWAFFTLTFFMYQLNFILVLFSIFFSNTDKKTDQQDNVHNPVLNK
ncbi:hypothetical protein ABNC55_20860 [Paenibacillus larvae]